MWSVPFSVWRLMFAYALMMGGVALTVLIAGIIGTDFAPTPGLATMPIALAIIGVAASTLPTGKLQARFGRRSVFLAYGALAIVSALMGALSLIYETFIGYCLATFAMGWASAAGHQYRFAALELVPAAMAPAAISVLLLGGIVGAFIGPEMAVGGRTLLDTEYAGSYLLLMGCYTLGMVLVGFYREQGHVDLVSRPKGRPLKEVLQNPVVVLAICSSAASYGVMTFLMTATPISMHEHSGHSIEATKWVIQSHIIAMYLPSMVFAYLYSKFGARGMLWLGVSALVITLATGLSGITFSHYLIALSLLGVGWNFLFLTGTNLLALGHRPEERFRVQSFNDFLTFSVQAMVSLGSGWFLFKIHWDGLLWTGAVPVIAFSLLLLSTRAWAQLARKH
jgi:MFS family permease